MELSARKMGMNYGNNVCWPFGIEGVFYADYVENKAKIAWNLKI